MDAGVGSRKATGSRRGGGPERATEARLAGELQRALARIESLAGQLFLLQEQNQQLRNDLAQRVCPRICTRPYRSAS